jgi:hypothetical protein
MAGAFWVSVFLLRDPMPFEQPYRLVRSLRSDGIIDKILRRVDGVNPLTLTNLSTINFQPSSHVLDANRTLLLCCFPSADKFSQNASTSYCCESTPIRYAMPLMPVFVLEAKGSNILTVFSTCCFYLSFWS